MTARLFHEIQAGRMYGFPLVPEAAREIGIRERRAVPERKLVSHDLWNGIGGQFFLLIVAVLLAMDLGLFQRKAHEVKLSEAVQSTSLRVALALLFCAGIYLGWIGGYDTRQRGFTSWLGISDRLPG